MPASLLSQAAIMPEKRRGPSVAICELVRVGLGVGEQLRQVLRRHARMRQHHEAHLGDPRNHGEVLHRIVGQRLEGVGIDHQRGRGGVEERVAVRRRARRRLRADDVAAARAVLVDDRLADAARKLVGDEAADHVGAAAGGLRTDELDGPVRPVLRVSGAGQRRQRHQQHQQAKQLGHAIPPNELRRPRVSVFGEVCSGSP